MKIKLSFLIYVMALTFSSCVADGVEYEEDYTHSDNIVDKPENDANDLEQAQYHFEQGLKMAVLDKDTIGDWEGAILELDKSLALNPNFQKAYHYKAIINSYLQNYQNAMDNINQAISIDDKAIESYFVRAAYFPN
jgi:lipoprotein NlpI